MIVLKPDALKNAVGCSIETASVWATLLSGSAVLHQINTEPRMRMWLATIAHESTGLTRFEENLNYSAVRLAQVWPNRFGPGLLDPKKYAYRPEILANYVYDDANRDEKHKLGNYKPGDGWLFRGRGPIQLTGRNNYQLCSIGLDIDLIRWPDLLIEPPVGARSAAWMWDNCGANQAADVNDFALAVRLISGGQINIEDRIARYEVVQSTDFA